MRFEAKCRTTGIGSLPHRGPVTACNIVLNYFDIPYWPQLPQRSYRESMPQFFEGFPGFVKKSGKLYIDPEKFDSGLEAFYQRLIEFETGGNFDSFTISEQYAKGLHAFPGLKNRLKDINSIKGQIIGPISFGLNVTGRNERPMLYDDAMRDALIKNLEMKVRYQEELLRTISPNTMIFVDESSLDLIYNPHVGYDEEKTRQDLSTILNAIRGLKGIHCCTNTNWPFLFELVDVISFDAYNYAHNFLLHHKAVKSFIEKGGIIAWGIVPASEDVLHENSISLLKRLESNFEYLALKGINFEDLLKQCLITPACGLGTRSRQIAMRAFELTREISDRLRYKYSL